MAQVQAPQFKLPKIDLDTLFAVQKANLAVIHEAQNVLVDAAQAIVRKQHGFVAELVEKAKAASTNKAQKKPEQVLAEVQAATEKALSVSKENVDLSFGAQRRVADLVTRRVQANVNEFKALAA
jgi:hypothetical protein